MNTQKIPMSLARALTPSRFAAGALVAFALLTAACSESASRVTSPALLASSSNGSSAVASPFAVLANAAVTCTNGTITGDVGTFLATPLGSVTLTSCPVTGALHVGDAAAVDAYRAFLNDYAALAPVPSDVCPIITGTLAGQSLAAGTYCLSAEAKTGVLTLTGSQNDTWIFKVLPSGTGALTGTNFTVLMAGGAQPCNVTWWSGAATTMTTSAFQGNILSGAAITMTGGTLNGNAYAKADVTTSEGTVITGCAVSQGNFPSHDQGQGNDKDKEKCNQGVGNGPEGCDPGNSNHRHGSNDENGGTPGNPGRKGGH